MSLRLLHISGWVGKLAESNRYYAHKDINQMDSHNLATVFLPVLVRSADIQQDVLICTMPWKMKNLDKASETLQRQKQDSASLGTIIKLCIERYDEIFGGGENGRLESCAMTPESSRSTSTASHSSTVSCLFPIKWQPKAGSTSDIMP